MLTAAIIAGPVARDAAIGTACASIRSVRLRDASSVSGGSGDHQGARSSGLGLPGVELLVVLHRLQHQAHWPTDPIQRLVPAQ